MRTEKQAVGRSHPSEPQAGVLPPSIAGLRQVPRHETNGVVAPRRVPGRQPLLLVRTACSIGVGTGHLRRSIEVVNELRSRGFTHVQLATDDDPVARRICASSDLAVRFLPPTRLLPAAQTRPDLLVLDTPVDPEALISRATELARLHALGTRIVSVGHLVEPAPYLKAVINLYPVGRSCTSAYQEGPQLTCLREEFMDRQKPGTGPRLRLLLTMGGTDPFQLTELGLTVLRLAGNTSPVDLIVPPAAGPARTRVLKDLAARCPFEVRAHKGVRDMRPLMRGAFAGLIAFGTTAYEMMTQGTPVLAFTHYRWQTAPADLYQAKKACFHLGCAELGIDTSKAVQDVKTMLAQRTRLERMAWNGFHLVDGKGASRVAGLVAGFLPTHGSLYPIDSPLQVKVAV